MTRNAEAFDCWIRTDFVAMNTELEELYFAREDRSAVEGIGDGIKQRLCEEGRRLIAPLLAEGRTTDGFGSAFHLLGNVGLYLGALRRHELTNPDREEQSPHKEASALALHVGAAAGMAPRFATAHLATHNLAVNGLRKSFTALHDEFLFIDENTRSILSFQNAADALRRLVAIGVSSPVADVLFEQASVALEAVIRFNQRLFETLDVDRFFYSVRPYYKPYRVGRQIYRGANAGDFPGINEIDLLLGLCRASDPYYSQLLLEKMPFMMPDDQAQLRGCIATPCMLDAFLLAADSHADQPWFQTNARAFLKLCDTFGRTARQHHDMLVDRFITRPAAQVNTGALSSITASGPPLDVLLRSLERLRDYRCAAPRDDVPTRHGDIERLRALVDTGC
ncbi:MAG: DUF1864 family protein [Sphingomonadales bacterium]|nr:DUF1864 family protein [Sphingomonadales bacterium]MDE2171716.1 DUF1864 family protein [Sphingomonadales bacterium]